MSPGELNAYSHRPAAGNAFEFRLALGQPRVQARIHALNGVGPAGAACGGRRCG